MKIALRMPNWLGDAVLALPALHSLRRAFPEAEIHAVTRSWGPDLLEGHPSLNGVIPLPEARDLKALRTSGTALKTFGFDRGILLTNSFSSAFVFYLAGIPERWGYARDGRGILLTRAVPFKNRDGVRHQADFYLHLIQALGIEPAGLGPGLISNENDTAWADEVLEKWGDAVDRPLVVLCPGAAYGPAKRWPADRFAALARRLREEAGAAVAVVGESGDAAAAALILEALDGHGLDLTGQTTLSRLIAVLRRARLVVTNDSGPLHIADAVGVPLVALFGPTNPAATGPRRGPAAVLKKEVPCWPCLYRSCPYDHRCMTRIEVEEAFEACRQLIA
ncbi:MAG: lipopolysaccharide heptosyltransferase II [Acidobacteriota bacterium]|nr:lipopolysaccharide heptosyltransferase II [Acidobacteriota bacterium]